MTDATSPLPAAGLLPWQAPSAPSWRKTAWPTFIPIRGFPSCIGPAENPTSAAARRRAEPAWWSSPPPAPPIPCPMPG